MGIGYLSDPTMINSWITILYPTFSDENQHFISIVFCGLYNNKMDNSAGTPKQKFGIYIP